MTIGGRTFYASLFARFVAISKTSSSQQCSQLSKAKSHKCAAAATIVSPRTRTRARESVKARAWLLFSRPSF